MTIITILRLFVLCRLTENAKQLKRHIIGNVFGKTVHFESQKRLKTVNFKEYSGISMSRTPIGPSAQYRAEEPKDLSK